ncbi:MAG: hypothetical protein SGBAC_011045 [Bacillariaceae sp.]
MEIYLSYSEPNLQIAMHLKEDIETYASLDVVLENEDWEQVESYEFEEQIHLAAVLLHLSTETSDVTVWLIDENKRQHRSKKPPTEVLLPPSIDISKSYEEGVTAMLGLIAKNMERRCGPLQMNQEEEEEYDSSDDYGSTPLKSQPESRRCLSSETKVDSDLALRPNGRKNSKEGHHLSVQQNSMRDLFAKSKMASERTLDRNQALKARKKKRAARKNRLQEARALPTVRYVI